MGLIFKLSSLFPSEVGLNHTESSAFSEPRSPSFPLPIGPSFSVPAQLVAGAKATERGDRSDGQGSWVPKLVPCTMCRGHPRAA